MGLGRFRLIGALLSLTSLAGQRYVVRLKGQTPR